MDVKTTDNYMLRMFAIGFTKKRKQKPRAKIVSIFIFLAKEEQNIRFEFKVGSMIVGSMWIKLIHTEPRM